PSAVPADHRPWLENFQCVQYSRSHTIEPRKHKAVNVAEGQSLRGFAPQHVELVSKDEDLGFQRSPRPKQSDQGAPDQTAKIAHGGRVAADSGAGVGCLGLGVGTRGGTPPRHLARGGAPVRRLGRTWRAPHAAALSATRTSGWRSLARIAGPDAPVGT